MELTYYPTHTRMAPWLIGMIFAYILFNTRDKRVHFTKVRSFQINNIRSLRMNYNFSLRLVTCDDLLGINVNHIWRLYLVYVHHSANRPSKHCNRVGHLLISDANDVAHCGFLIDFVMRPRLRRPSQ